MHVQRALRWAPERAQTEVIDVPDADVRLTHGYLSAEEATARFEHLLDAVPWKQDTITIFGRTSPVPRLHQWYGEPGTVYRWSGIEMVPLPWLPALDELRARIETFVGIRLNSLLINRYRSGADSVGWHADDEPVLGERPVIASLSLGETRDFVLRHRHRPDLQHTIALRHGSLLVMAGDTQTNWQHAVPKRKRVRGERLNLTFRHTMSS